MHWTLHAVGRGVQRALSTIDRRLGLAPSESDLRVAQLVQDLARDEQEEVAALVADSPGAEEDAGEPPSSEPPGPPPFSILGPDLGLDLPPDQILWAAEMFGPMPGDEFFLRGEEKE